jgi:hypothetical protein
MMQAKGAVVAGVPMLMVCKLNYRGTLGFPALFFAAASR